ncbi:hypothetical protein KPH14_005066 [Odynerus spinipes]|uniref:Uncharacterized protein n=1 Tax=Odynerus spinipes TaxID=1348599 RepID=A0AAD9RKF1_9HYME|nr:hypothetical protein KPH14_005066 [Odynerus spinipes]
MKLTLFTLLALCLIAACRSAEEEYDYEEEPAAVVSPTPSKPAAAAGRLGGLLSSRGRVNVGRKAATPAQSTTAKPVEQPQPVEEEEEVEEVLEDVEEQEEVVTTTTESLKKVHGGVRPFRSNEDLIAALKRRRAQAGPSSHTRESSATQPQAESTTPRSRTSTSSRNKSGSSSGGETKTTTSSRGRFGSSRGKPVQEEVEESQRDEIQVKPKPYRRG